MNTEIPARALVIASPHIDRILAGEKTWEMRSRNCRIRGPIGLIKKGSGTVVGLAEITDVIDPLPASEGVAADGDHDAQLTAPLDDDDLPAGPQR